MSKYCMNHRSGLVMIKVYVVVVVAEPAQTICQNCELLIRREMESLRVLLQADLLIGLLVTLASAPCVGGQAQGDVNEFCPKSAQCTCGPDGNKGPDLVRVHCNIAKFDSTTNLQAELGLLPNHTAALQIACSPDYWGELSSSNFGDLPLLYDLDLDNCMFPEIPARVFSSLPNLTILQIHTNDQGRPRLSVHPDAFQGLKKLKILNLAHTPLALHQNQFCGLGVLEYLRLANCSLTTEHLESIGYHDDRQNLDRRSASCLPNLVILDLSSNRLTSLMASFSRATPRLIALILSDNHIQQISDRAFRGLSNLRNLTLAQNRLEHFSDRALKGLINLTLLNLTRNNLNSIQPTLFEDLSRLAYLCLSNNDIGPSLDSETFSHFTRLEVLQLRSCGIHSLDAMPFKSMASLVSLDVSGNNISSLPPRSTSSLTNLKIFNISNNNLGITNLANETFQNLESLAILDISGNQISDIEDGTFIPLKDLMGLVLNANRLLQVPKAVRNLDSLTDLKLDSNLITAIQEDDFVGLKKLEHIFLGNNHIDILPNNVFTNLRKLKRLLLNNNQISTASVSAFQARGDKSLKIFWLDLSHNSLNSIEGLLNPLANLQYLFLSGNKIRSIFPADLPLKLKIIDLSENALNEVARETFDKLSELQSVNMQANRISSLPQKTLSIHPTLWKSEHVGMKSKCTGIRRPIFQLHENAFKCDCNMTYLLTINQNQRYGYVSDYGQIQCRSVFDPEREMLASKLTDSQFLCTYRQLCRDQCQCCHQSLGSCPCRYAVCPNKCICAVDGKQSVNIVKCTASGLRQIPTGIPSKAHTIKLDGNLLKTVTRNSFQENSEARVLFLNNSRISKLDSGTFQGLSALQTLHLEGNRLNKLRSDSFFGLDNLSELILSENKLRSIDNNTFSSLKRLEVLDLRNNELGTIPLEDFKSMEQTPRLFLGGNPWTCDCKVGPQLQSWVTGHIDYIQDLSNIFCSKDSNVNQRADSHNVSEVTDDDMGRVRLQYADFSQCYVESNSHDILISALCGFVCLCVLGILVFRFFNLVEVWLYARYRIRFRKQTEDQSKIFDAFISYSSRDESFVVRELLPRLESGNPKFNICVSFRNWKGGSCIADSIIESVETSHRTILLLSQDFVENEWCSYEFKTAHHQVIHDKNCRLIVVVMADKPPSNLDKDLGHYIKTNTYLRRKDRWFWEKLYFAMPDDKVRRRCRSTNSTSSTSPENLLLA